MAAVEQEARSGRPTNGKWHETTLNNALNTLKNKVFSDPHLDPVDHAVATNTQSYIRTELKAFDSAVAEGSIKIGTGANELSPPRANSSIIRFYSEVEGAAMVNSPSPWSSSTGDVGGDDDFAPIDF